MCTLPTDLWALALAGCLFQLGWREEEGLCLDQGPGYAMLRLLVNLDNLNMYVHTHTCVHTLHCV